MGAARLFLIGGITFPQSTFIHLCSVVIGSEGDSSLNGFPATQFKLNCILCADCSVTNHPHVSISYGQHPGYVGQLFYNTGYK